MSVDQPPDLAVSRRTALRLLASGTGVLLLAACGPAAPSSTAPPPTSAAPPPTSAPGPTLAPTAVPAATATAVPAAAANTAAPQPRRGGTLRIAIPIDIARLDGHYRTAPVYDS